MTEAYTRGLSDQIKNTAKVEGLNLLPFVFV